MQRKKSDVIDALIQKTRDNADYKSLERILQIIKQVFKSSANAEDAENKDYEEGETKSHKKKAAPKAAKKHVFAKALSSSEEYVKLLKFFGADMPQMILKLVDASLTNEKQPVKKDAIDMNKVTKKLKNLLKTFSSLYTSLLA